MRLHELQEKTLSEPLCIDYSIILRIVCTAKLGYNENEDDIFSLYFLTFRIFPSECLNNQKIIL